MTGDLVGSYFKRRKGHKREGNESSQAPILDTLTFAVAIFIAAFHSFRRTNHHQPRFNE